MQAELLIRCGQCGQRLDNVKMDTADMPEELQARVNAVVLAHRKDCKYYYHPLGPPLPLKERGS